MTSVQIQAVISEEGERTILFWKQYLSLKMTNSHSLFVTLIELILLTKKYWEEELKETYPLHSTSITHDARDIFLASSSPVLHIPTYQYAKNHLSNTLSPYPLPPHHFSPLLSFSSDQPDSILLTLSPLQSLSLCSQLTQKQKEKQERISTSVLQKRYGHFSPFTAEITNE